MAQVKASQLLDVVVVAAVHLQELEYFWQVTLSLLASAQALINLQVPVVVALEEGVKAQVPSVPPPFVHASELVYVEQAPFATQVVPSETQVLILFKQSALFLRVISVHSYSLHVLAVAFQEQTPSVPSAHPA